ncbi:MAG: molybdopterin-dependent oxidoreductase, partial [Chloroflexi bacterium]|nr:molybdopterin-dependent oxidoreductase [Chloroflexota bacterium]
MVKIKINGQEIEVPEEVTVLQAAAQAGVTIPTLCDHPDLEAFGGCRLCVVDVKGWRTPMASCVMPVEEGMEVETHTPAIEKSRKTILEMLMSNYYDSGYKNGQKEETQFMRWVKHYGLDVQKSMAPAPRYKVDSDANPFVFVDLNKCIQCTCCVRACADIQGRFVWNMAERGFGMHPVAGMDANMLDARCESCGACVAYCPTGALDNRMSMGAGAPDKLVMTTCTYCGVGCQFELNVKDGKVIRVTSTEKAPVNGNHLCVKGRYGYDFIHHPDRLTKPKVRRYLLDGKKKTTKGKPWEWVETDWDTALNLAARKLHEIRAAHGADSLGVLTSAKCTNEENYLMNKFARQVLGTNNIDHCARLCHSSTVSGLAASFGSGAMSNSMDDVAEHAELLFIIGSNTTEQHPVFGAMLRQAARRRGAKLIVADPRRIDITEFATLHLRQKSGSDIALINGLMYLILENGWEDKAFIEERCENFDEFKAAVMQYPPEKVSEITGVSVEDLRYAAQLMGENRPMAVIWAMGITQHIVGVRNVMDLANLQMLLGNMGKPGGGVNPLRGQNNVQGACDMGGLPNVFPGYQPVTSEDAVKKFESAWGAAAPAKVGLTVTEMIPGILEGKIHALYALGENPVMSDADSAHIRRCFEAIDLLVLQEIFPSETSAYADILLPGVSFAEKTGTFTNTERRVQMVRK